MNEWKIHEKYKRLVKLLFSSILIIGLTMIYAVVWIGYYNRYILQIPFYRRGNWVIILMYAVLIVFFMTMYGGFKVGYLKRGNLIYSQIVSVFFVNLFTYVQIAVIDKRFVDPLYIVIMSVVDISYIIAWTMLFQTVYTYLFPPRKMLFISGDRQDYHLKDKMNSREDKYEICEMISYHVGLEKIKKRVVLYDSVIIGDIPSHERNQIVKFCFLIGKRSYSVPKVSDILLKSSDELNLFDTPLLLSRNIGLTMEQQIVKRIEDVIISILMLVMFSPVFLVAAIGIKCTDGGKIFYKQERLTQDNKVFMIYKFRTMIERAEQISGPVLASDKDPRIIPIGRILRATRMDELPQLINILKGDMSIVGPRPERPLIAREIEKNIPEFNFRLKVKAGLTGYAQVYGKYNTKPYDKLKLDLTYIRRYSLLLDLKLIIMTPKILFIKESTEGVENQSVSTKGKQI